MSVKKERTIAVLMRFVITPKDIISIITLMIIQENKIKMDKFLKDFGPLRCRSRAALIDNKLVFLKWLPSVFLTET